MQQRQCVQPLKILVTAGATREMIDPVRFISNRSTGFLGCAIARLAHARGHQVFLIYGALSCLKPRGVPAIEAPSVLQMREELSRKFSWCDCLLMTAAVSDFSPKTFSRNKIKRRAQKELVLRLKQNPDILAGLGKRKGARLLVGFALETENLKRNALAKLQQKNTDFLVAVQLGKSRPPFGNGCLNVLLIDKEGGMQELSNIGKTALARLLLNKIEKTALHRLKLPRFTDRFPAKRCAMPAWSMSHFR